MAFKRAPSSVPSSRDTLHKWNAAIWIVIQSHIYVTFSILQSSKHVSVVHQNGVAL